MPASSEAAFLLDTNVISEVSRPRPAARVMTWLAEADEDRIFISVATLAEINRGIELLAVGRKQRRFREWLLNDLVERFDGRVLPVDAATGLLWGQMAARAQKAGRTIEAIDALLAATAERHGLTLVTRNSKDFAALRLPLLNPWDETTR
jgi:toxin FitB